MLVETGVFEEVVVSHMPVGHTHGDVDQIFSNFAAQLRKLELPTFETLLSEMEKIPIDSKPLIVKEMVFTTDFSEHISKLLQPISGHTAFFQFKIRKENEVTKMFLKQDVLEEIWQFSGGVWLLKSPPTMTNLQVSPFRTESDYGEIFSSVWSKYIPTLTVKYSEEEIVKIKLDWEERISFLIQLEESQFEAFDVFKFVSSIQRQDLSDNFQRRMEKEITKEATLTATFYAPEIKGFSVSDLFQDCSVVFYTASRKTRPWVGLFVELIKNRDSVQIKVEWLIKKEKYFVLDSKPDGSVYYSLLDIETVMFVDVLRNISYSSNRKGPYILDPETKKQIFKEYTERDSVFSEID